MVEHLGVYPSHRSTSAVGAWPQRQLVLGKHSGVFMDPPSTLPYSQTIRLSTGIQKAQRHVMRVIQSRNNSCNDLSDLDNCASPTATSPSRQPGIIKLNSSSPVAESKLQKPPSDGEEYLFRHACDSRSQTQLPAACAGLGEEKTLVEGTQLSSSSPGAVAAAAQGGCLPPKAAAQHSGTVSTDRKSASRSDCLPCWEELPVGILSSVAKYVALEGPTAGQTWCSVCRGWRESMLSSPSALRAVKFHPDVQHVFKHLGDRVPAYMVRLQLAKERFPALLQRAAAASNASALLCSAHLHATAGRRVDAMRCWQKLAKLGDMQVSVKRGVDVNAFVSLCHIWIKLFWLGCVKSSPVVVCKYLL